MNKTQNSFFILLAMLLTQSCHLPLQNTSPLNNKSTAEQITDPNIISFLILNIHSDANKSTNIVTLISKKE